MAIAWSVGCVPAGAPRDVAPQKAPPITTRDAGRVATPPPRDGGDVITKPPVDAGLEPDGGFEPDAGLEPDASVPDAGPMPEPPPHTPMYRIDVRVHVGESNLSEAEQLEIFEEMQRIWWHAGVCFEFEIVDHDDVRQGGFDLWYVPRINNPSGVNGVYFNDHRILTRDEPGLREVTDGTDIWAARTGAHELGHALNLDHRQNNTNLMASGTTGWTLNAAEIRSARSRAAQKALPDTTPLACGVPRMNLY